MELLIICFFLGVIVVAGPLLVWLEYKDTKDGRMNNEDKEERL